MINLSNGWFSPSDDPENIIHQPDAFEGIVRNEIHLSRPAARETSQHMTVGRDLGGDFPTTGKWLASDVTTCHWTRPGCSYLMLRSAKLISTWASPQSPDGRTGGPTTRVRGPVNRWRPAQVSHLVTGGKSKWLGVIIVDLPIIKIGGSFHSYVNVYQRVCSFPIIGGPSDCQKPSPSWPTTSATFTAFKST